MSRRRLLIGLMLLAALVAFGLPTVLGGTYAPFNDTESISGSAQAGIWTGTIIIEKDVEKDVEPEPDGTDFSFTASGTDPSVSNFSLDDDAEGTLSNTQTFADIEAPGTYTISEDGETGYSIQAISCSINDGGANNGSSVVIQGFNAADAGYNDGDDEVVITLAAGDEVKCTFTNKLQAGSITITKDTEPDDDTVFSFDAVAQTNSINPASFDLWDDGNDAGDEASRTFATLIAPDVYTFTEQAEAGYHVADIACTITGSGGSSVDIGLDGDAVFEAGDNAVAVSLQPGDHVECTFTNEPNDGTLTLIKQVITDDGGTAVSGDWTIEVRRDDAQGDLVESDPGLASPGRSYTLAPGTYYVSETGGPAGYELTYSSDCLGGLVTVVSDQEVTCTLTNDDPAPGSLTIQKVCKLPNGDETTQELGFFDLTAEWGNDSDTTSDVGCGEETDPIAIPAGVEITVSEAAGTNTDLGDFTSVIGGDCASDGTITLASGEDATCIITNTVDISLPNACVAQGFEIDDFVGNIIIGTANGETLSANPANVAHLIFGLGGNDTINGSNQSDCLVGGPGDDTINAGQSGGSGLPNYDVLFGGPGDDTLNGENGNDYMDGGEGNDTCDGSPGNPTDDIFVSCETQLP